ncbi:MAG TPA: CoA-binding protein [Chitinophagaceae bacterium]|nr:CoA-binding protein [Chitinophagaceae bacterium]
MPEKKKTLVLGASDNPSRYSYLAVQRLRSHGHPVVAIGKKNARVADVPIEKEKKEFDNIDTVTLYLNPLHQEDYYDYILSLKPKRIIFNPGAENENLAELAAKHNIKAIEACTLVLLSTGQY